MLHIMCVNTECGVWILMSQPILYFLDIPVLVQQQGSAGVTELMKRDLRTSEALHIGLEAP